MKLTRVLKSVFLAFILLSTIQTAVTYSDEEEVKFPLDKYFHFFQFVDLKLVDFPTSDDYRLYFLNRHSRYNIYTRIGKFKDNKYEVALSLFQHKDLAINIPNSNSYVNIHRQNINVFLPIKKTHIVKAGETGLQEIATEHYRHNWRKWWEAIAYANGLLHPYTIKPGQKLKIPDIDSKGYIEINYPGDKTVKSLSRHRDTPGDKTVKTKDEELTAIQIRFAKYGSVVKSFPKGTKLELGYTTDGHEIRYKTIIIGKGSRTSQGNILEIFNEHFKDYGDKFTLEVKSYPKKKIPACKFKKKKFSNEENPANIHIETYKEVIKIITPLPTEVVDTNIRDYKSNSEDNYFYIATDHPASELKRGPYYVLLEGCEMLYFRVDDAYTTMDGREGGLVYKAQPKFPPIHITTSGDNNFPENTQVQLKYFDCDETELVEEASTNKESLITRQKLLDELKRYYQKCGDRFELSVTFHNTLPEDIFKPYQFTGKEFPRFKINFKQYKYTKIKFEDDWDVIIAAAKKKGYEAKKKYSYIYIWKSKGNFEGRTLAINEDYESLELNYFENENDILIPEKVIKQITLLHKNEDFPPETAFALNLDCKHERRKIKDEIFKLGADSIVPQTIIEKIQGHYKNARSVTLKVKSHPKLPADIFREFEFETSDTHDPPNIEAVFKQHKYAKIKWPESKPLSLHASHKEKYTIIGVDGEKCTYVLPKKNYFSLKDPIRFEGYYPKKLVRFRNDKDILKLKKIFPQYVKIHMDNKVRDLKFYNTSGNLHSEPLQLKRKKRKDEEYYVYILPTENEDHRRDTFEFRASSDDDRKLKATARDGVKRDDAFYYKADFGKLINVKLNNAHGKNSGISASLRETGQTDKLAKYVSKENGMLYFRGKELRNYKEDELEVEIKRTTEDDNIYFKQTVFKYKNLKDGGSINLHEPSHFYLSLTGPVDWITIGENSNEININGNEKIKLKWDCMDQNLRLGIGSRPSEYPEFDYSPDYRNIPLEKKQLKSYQSNTTDNYPLLTTGMKRKPVEGEQELIITYEGDWDGFDKKVKITTQDDKPFELKSNIGSNTKKYTIKDQYSSKIKIKIDDADQKSSKNKFNIKIKEEGSYRDIKEIEGIGIKDPENKITLKLLPINKNSYKITVTDKDGKTLSGDYRTNDISDWRPFESNTPIKANVYGPLKLHVRCDGYKPKVKPFTSPMEGEIVEDTIIMGDRELPLWIIIHAPSKLNQYWKELAKGIDRYVNYLKEETQKRVKSSQIWVTCTKNESFRSTSRLETTKLSTLIRETSPEGPLDGLAVLRKISKYSMPEEMKEAFVKDGFNLCIITFFEQKYMQKENNTITEYSKIRYDAEVKDFLGWLHKAEISQGLSILSLIDIYIKENTKNSAFYYFNDFFKDEIKYLRYKPMHSLNSIKLF